MQDIGERRKSKRGRGIMGWGVTKRLWRGEERKTKDQVVQDKWEICGRKESRGVRRIYEDCEKCTLLCLPASRQLFDFQFYG